MRRRRGLARGSALTERVAVREDAAVAMAALFSALTLAFAAIAVAAAAAHEWVIAVAAAALAVWLATLAAAAVRRTKG